MFFCLKLCVWSKSYFKATLSTRINHEAVRLSWLSGLKQAISELCTNHITRQASESVVKSATRWAVMIVLWRWPWLRLNPHFSVIRYFAVPAPLAQCTSGREFNENTNCFFKAKAMLIRWNLSWPNPDSSYHNRTKTSYQTQRAHYPKLREGIHSLESDKTTTKRFPFPLHAPKPKLCEWTPRESARN